MVSVVIGDEVDQVRTRRTSMQSHRLPSGSLWRVLGLVITLASAPWAVASVFYQWIDEDGGVHLTDDLSKIPKNYRDEAREIPMSDEITKPEAAPSRPSDSAAPSPSSEDVDFQGHNRQWWQQRLQDWRGRKASAEQRLAEARDRYNRLYSDHQPLRAVRQEIEQYETDIREADRMLTDVIPDEARKAGVPPGWVRE